MVWHWVVKSWLRQKAQEKVYEAVAETARQRASSEKVKADGGQTEPVDVAVVFALEIEAGGFEDLLEEAVTTRGDKFVVRQGRLRGKSVLIVVAGAGSAAARRATEAVVIAHRPAWVISAGFVGGLADNVRRGDFVLADSLTNEDGQVVPVDTQRLTQRWKPPARAHTGRVLTVNRILRDPREKAELGRKHQALAADTESIGVALGCRGADCQWLALRVVGDEVNDRVPAELEHLMQQDSTAGKLGAVIGSVFRRPSSVKDMLREKEEALVASDRLAAVLADFVETLEGPPSE